MLTVATVLAGLDTFLDSVYFTARRTGWSMGSALSGALLNLLLNTLLIPRFGAMGASVATLISYLCVLVLRMVTTRRLIRFRQGRVRLALNILFLTAQAGFMTATGEEHMPSVWGWVLTGAASVALLALNMRTLIRIGVRLARGLRGRLRGKETETT